MNRSMIALVCLSLIFFPTFSRAEHRIIELTKKEALKDAWGPFKQSLGWKAPWFVLGIEKATFQDISSAENRLAQIEALLNQGLKKPAFIATWLHPEGSQDLFAILGDNSDSYDNTIQLREKLFVRLVELLPNMEKKEDRKLTARLLRGGIVISISNLFQ